MMSGKNIRIIRTSGLYAVTKLTRVPDLARMDGIWFFAKTDDACSLVCGDDCVPAEASAVEADGRC